MKLVCLSVLVAALFGGLGTVEYVTAQSPETTQARQSSGRKASPSEIAHIREKTKIARAAKPPGGPTLTLKAVADKLLRKRESQLDTDNKAVRSKVGNGLIKAARGGRHSSCSAPVVQEIAMAPPLVPGEELLLNGTCFGTAAGELRLVGNFPGGHLKLTILQWLDHAVSARVPPVTGAKDQISFLRLVTHDLKLSNARAMPFEATREVKQLKESDMQITCSGTDFDYCKAPWPGLSLMGGKPMPGATFGASHHVNDGDETNMGADIARVSLKNGWKIAGWGWSWGVGLEDESFSFVLPPVGLAEGASSATIQTFWGTVGGAIQYRVDLFVIGPEGVPYK